MLITKYADVIAATKNKAQSEPYFNMALCVLYVCTASERPYIIGRTKRIGSLLSTTIEPIR